MNKLFTSGRLANDPELSTLQSGQTVCKFRMASNTRKKDPNTNEYTTNWYNCSAWGALGENIAKYFKKGSRINISGDLSVREYVDRNGAQRTSIDLDVRDFDFVDSSTQQEQPQASPALAPQRVAAPAPRPVPPAPAPSAPDDDLPF